VEEVIRRAGTKPFANCSNDECLDLDGSAPLPPGLSPTPSSSD
jgi:hypothetical protein